MTHAAINTRALLGMDAPAVTVETHLPGGLPGFTLVGLPETAVREARDRVKSAIQNCGFQFPRGRVVVNLAPADLVKEGARYDLAIAVSILCATNQLPGAKAARYEYLGELSLYGDVRAVRGVLGAVGAHSARGLIVPARNGHELGLQPIQGADVLTLDHLQRLPELLQDPGSFVHRPSPRNDGSVAAVETAGADSSTALTPPADAAGPTLDAVVGQRAAKRALLVAAAGGHHLLMVGPPGAGKTMLARALAALLPPLPQQQALEVAAVYSSAGLMPPGQRRPPFREPHHSASAPALAGTISRGRVAPGEISLAHRGVLFLDELPHFKPSVLDLLREPLSNGEISIARAYHRSHYPAEFQLVAAMNPCPTGQSCRGSNCRCSAAQVRQYQRRLSGPLLDRIDLQISVPAVPPVAVLQPVAQPASAATPGEGEHQAAYRQVQATRQRQYQRRGWLNSEQRAPLPTAIAAPAHELLVEAAQRLDLSARAVHRCLRVAQTCADLESSEAIATQHVAEALAYRSLDWGGFLGMTGPP